MVQHLNKIIAIRLLLCQIKDMKLESIRREYKRAELSKESAGNDPFSFFDKWMQEALEENPDHATSRNNFV